MPGSADKLGKVNERTSNDFSHIKQLAITEPYQTGQEGGRGGGRRILFYGPILVTGTYYSRR